jgi:hypothetical protein
MGGEGKGLGPARTLLVHVVLDLRVELALERLYRRPISPSAYPPVRAHAPWYRMYRSGRSQSCPSTSTTRRARQHPAAHDRPRSAHAQPNAMSCRFWTPTAWRARSAGTVTNSARGSGLGGGDAVRRPMARERGERRGERGKQEAGGRREAWTLEDGRRRGGGRGQRGARKRACCGVACPTRCGRTRAVWPASFKQFQVTVAIADLNSTS